MTVLNAVNSDCPPTAGESFDYKHALPQVVDVELVADPELAFQFVEGLDEAWGLPRWVSFLLRWPYRLTMGAVVSAVAGSELMVSAMASVTGNVRCTLPLVVKLRLRRSGL